MKTLTVRLPAPLVAEIDAESRARGLSRSDVVRERLRHPPRRAAGDAPAPLAAIADLVGAVDGLPTDLSTRTRRHLQATGYGRRRPR